MQPLRTSVGQVSRQLNRNRMNSLFAPHFSHNSKAAMSLFPGGFGQECSSPIFRLFDQQHHSRQALFPGLDRQLNHMRSFSPRFDVKETKEGYELQGELPGVLQKDIDIEWIDDTTLTISGRHELVREAGRQPQALEEKEDGSEKRDQMTGNHASVETNTDIETQSAATQQQQSTESNAEKKQEQEHTTQQDKYWISERSIGEFQRSFSFPTRVDQDAVTASLKNGILSVVIPRGAAPPKKILIQ